MAKRRDAGLLEAAEAVGGLARLARALEIPVQNVCRWERIPPHWVLAIEHATGIPRERLRPDLYGAPRPRPRRRQSLNAAA